MVHLITAYQYKPDSSAAFWVGNIAPDCIVDWKERDRFHFRNESDIEKALRDFARGIRKDDWFLEGMLLHLFVDWKWDQDLRQRFIRNHGADDWFHPYRNEIGLLSARLYHDTPWSAKIWADMINSDVSNFNPSAVIHSLDIVDTINRANKYHVDNLTAQPQFYTIESIKEFTATTAQEYELWRKLIV